MYFRLKQSNSGQVLQLIESYRNNQGKPRQRVVVSLGDAPISRSDWKPIAKAVQKRLYGIEELLPPQYSARQHDWIERILRRIDGQGRWQALRCRRPPKKAQAEQIIDGVLADEVEHGSTGLWLGPILLGLRGWESLELDEALKKMGFNPAQRRAAKLSVINRLVDPVSENALAKWVSQSALGDLLGAEVGKADRHRYYRVSDRLVKNRSKIEAHLRQRQGELFGLDRTVLLYDLTNTHFAGVGGLNAKAKRGRNKQKRHDCVQIVVGMVFDTEGFELGHRIFAGNRSDSTTLLEMIEELDQAAGGAAEREKTLIIMDGGIATEENVEYLTEEGFGYLVNENRRGRAAWAEAFSEPEGFEKVEGRDESREVKVKWLEEPRGQAGDGEAGREAGRCADKEYVLLCKSERRRAKEQAIYSGAEVRFLEALEALKSRIEAGRLKDPRKIERSIGRAQANHPRVQRYYHLEFTQAAGAKKSAFYWRRKDQGYEENAQLLGCYALRTNRDHFSASELWRLYMTLTRAERGFKALKSDLGLRPNYHQIERRVEGHVFISILAYQLLRFIEYHLEQHGDTRCWQTIKRVLQTHTYATLILPTRQGEVYHLRKAGIPEASHKQIYHLFGIKWNKLPVKKRMVKRKVATIL